MVSSTKITMIRHGETDWNVEGRIQGHLDIPLNARGIAQAAHLAKVISLTPSDIVYSSDLDRAYRTAFAITQENPSVIQREPLLRERHLGVLQALTRPEAEKLQPKAWRVFATRNVAEPLEQGESLQAFSDRVTQFLTSLCARHEGQHMILVTHGGVLDISCRLARGLSLETPRDFQIRNASINILRSEGGNWQVERWGDVAHLGSL